MSQRPNPLPRIYRWRTNLVQTPVMTLITAVCASISLLISLVERSGRAQHRIARVWARALVRAAGCSLTVRGAENLRKHPVVVFAANHTSYMDTPVIFAALPCQFRILAKKELWPIAFIGWYLNRSGQIPIDTANPHTTFSSLGVAVKALRAGMPLFIFPEGGRTPDGKLRPFLSGAAYLAIRAQVPVVPIALSGVYDLLPMHARHLYPGELTLSAGDPIKTAGMSLRQMGELTGQVREAIAAMLEPIEVEACSADAMALDSGQPAEVDRL
jgi:1-acyl-sn-glycerol-3-phosphate acyltransferase